MYLALTVLVRIITRNPFAVKPPNCINFRACSPQLPSFRCTYPSSATFSLHIPLNCMDFRARSPHLQRFHCISALQKQKVGRDESVMAKAYGISNQMNTDSSVVCSSPPFFLHTVSRSSIASFMDNVCSTS